MPIELRKLAFTGDEAAEAAMLYGHRAGLRFPVRRVPTVAVTDDPRARLRLHFPEEYQTGGQLFLFDDRQLLGALILYCRDRCIPLPKPGTKRVRGEAGRLVLLTRIERPGPKAHAA